MIDALVALGVPGGRVGRLDGYPGVWIDPDGPAPGKVAAPARCAAVGVRTARGRTTHGFALNVDDRPGHVRAHRARAGSPTDR